MEDQVGLGLVKFVNNLKEGARGCLLSVCFTCGYVHVYSVVSMLSVFGFVIYPIPDVGLS